MELLSLVQHNILLGGEQTTQGDDVLYSCTLNFLSPVLCQEKGTQKSFFGGVGLWQEVQLL